MAKANNTPTLSSTLAALKAKITAKDIANLERFAINPTKFFGVSMANLKLLAKQIGRSHELAAELWDSGWYEARMLATLIDEPAKVTAAQMDRWCKAFDNWGIVDTACFCLFDRTPFTFEKIHKWSKAKGEFQKRAAFALLWSTSLHDKTSGDEPFLKCLPLIEQAATDERNFVKKGVLMAIGAVARRSTVLHKASLNMANKLSQSPDATAKWIGSNAARELQRLKLRKSK